MSACWYFELSGCRHDLSVAISGSRPVCSPIVCSCELCVTSCKTKLLSQGPSSSIVQNGRENPQVFTALIPKSHFLPAIIRRRIFFYPKEFAYKGTCVTRTHLQLQTHLCTNCLKIITKYSLCLLAYRFCHFLLISSVTLQ